MNRVKTRNPFAGLMKNFIYQKIEYPNTTFAPIKAKNDTLTVNNNESVILCVFMTHSITLFYDFICKISVICAYIIYIFFIVCKWYKPPIRYP